MCYTPSIMPRKIIPYNSNLKELARKLRNDSTLGEALLWNEIKGKKLHGYDFQRQKPLLNYIVDFYYYELALVIEVDGIYHHNSEQYGLDVSREKELEEYNLTIIRFSEQEVRKDMVNVLRTLEGFILEFEEKQNSRF